MSSRLLVAQKFSRRLSGGLVAILFLALSACSSKPAVPVLPDNWQPDGLLVVSRPVPAPSVQTPDQVLAFLPAPVLHAGTWLLVSTAKQELSLMEGKKVVATASGEGVSKLAPGMYQLLHKQRNALWYAPDDYFTQRKLPVPAQGNRDRFRRGALGDFVLFLNKETPIHNGPVWTQEIGGVRLEEQDISKIYYHLPVGAVIEVREK